MSWHSQALCAKSEAGLDWTDAGQPKENVVRMQAVCRQCPVREPCLAEGEQSQASGVWGGLVLVRGFPSRRRDV